MSSEADDALASHPTPKTWHTQSRDHRRRTASSAFLSALSARCLESVQWKLARI